ncbi:DMT family transporter [Megasphaera massiliensis]|uniref:DMT family transporter n=1 Tax=Megasphaera massiliensis TaxID=1232428 RepID=UPI000419D211|nr:DMT family transporter [Megasphaera massiliensis]MBS6256649.1 DMT family transporter [Megasphaera sp.]MCQ5211217.1 DMT family transporter [Megasphaera massiliensis]MEE0657528.1 DMT family transporter [Megasphaera massiliensis]
MYQTEAKGTIFLLITALIWGSAFVAQSIGMDYIGPFTFSAARNVIAIIVLMPVILLFTDKRDDGTYPPIWQQLKPDAITLTGGAWCGLTLGIADTLQQVGITMTTAGKAGFITAIYIVLVPLMGFFIGRKVPRIIVFCVILAMTGFYFLCINGDFEIAFGDLLVFFCAIFFALHILVIDHFLLKKAHSIKMSWVQFAIAFLFSATLTILFESPTASMLWDAKWPILYAGGLSSGVAYTLQIVGQKYTEPTTATLILSLEAVFAVLAGWLILGEVMTGKEIVGCVLVFVAVILAQIPLPARLFGK